jgi:outer membrane lipoprotein-sorting protein|tara:strand:+ start:111 stop:347 length:237 start_codon:yes stop_codon:yes gene_type:complete
MKYIKILFGLLILVFLNGCIQNTALLGPAASAVSGNTLQAGLQFGTNSIIKRETGEDAFTHIKNYLKKEDIKDKNSID